MKKTNPVLMSLFQSLATFIYVAIVVGIMNNGEKIFSKANSMWGGVAILMLLVVSASICGFLVFGRSIMLFLENQKKESLKLLYLTIGWLAVFTVAVFLITSLIR